MKKYLTISVVFILFMLLLNSCAKIIDSNEDTSEITTTDRLTVINNDNSLSSYLKEASENITVVDDVLTGSSALKAQKSKKTSFKLTLIAEVSSPVVNGQTLQATKVQIQGNKALISYNMTGEAYLGAVDIIDIKNRKKPQIRSRILFNETDVHSITYADDKAYVAQSRQSDAGTPAHIESFKFKSSKISLEDSRSATVASYAVNSVFPGKEALYATSGSNGKLYAINYTTLDEIDSVDLSYARWVLENNNKIIVVRGMPGRVNIFKYDNNAFTNENSFTFTGANTEEAKSQAEAVNDMLFIAAGKGGVQVHKLSDGSKITEISLPDTELDSGSVVCNSVTIDKDLIFIANGAAGVYVAKAKNQIKLIDDYDLSLQVLGKLNLGSQQSVNHAAYKSNYLFVAAGLGGLKIIDIDNYYDDD
ncbi:MAG: hypothetical protein GY730_09480 [bacterium]|nr:hypothetical protein [bacterium]